MTQTTTEHAAALRQALKARGWTSRDVSVRANYFSLGSDIRVTINNPAVPLATVEAMATAHERINRNSYGEILGGGNRYVNVSYSSAATEILARRHIAALETAQQQLTTADDSTLIPIHGTGHFLGRNAYSGVSLWSDTSHVQSANTVEYLASVLAIRLQKDAQP